MTPSSEAKWDKESRNKRAIRKNEKFVGHFFFFSKKKTGAKRKKGDERGMARKERLKMRRGEKGSESSFVKAFLPKKRF